MSTNATDAENGTDCKKRLRRAVCEKMTVLELGGQCYEVVSSSGSTYGVDLGGEEPICTCPDFQHNLPTPDGVSECKHIMRAQVVAEQSRVIPAAIDHGDVDPLLGTAMPDTTPLHAGAADVETAADGGDRPDDCNCPSADHGLPCFQCYMSGFRSPPAGD